MRSNAAVWVGYAYGDMGLSYWHTAAFNIQPANFKQAATADAPQLKSMVADWQQSGLLPFVPPAYRPKLIQGRLQSTWSTCGKAGESLSLHA